MAALPAAALSAPAMGFQEVDERWDWVRLQMHGDGGQAAASACQSRLSGTGPFCVVLCLSFMPTNNRAVKVARRNPPATKILKRCFAMSMSWQQACSCGGRGPAPESRGIAKVNSTSCCTIPLSILQQTGRLNRSVNDPTSRACSQAVPCSRQARCAEGRRHCCVHVKGGRQQRQVLTFYEDRRCCPAQQ